MTNSLFQLNLFGLHNCFLTKKLPLIKRKLSPAICQFQTCIFIMIGCVNHLNLIFNKTQATGIEMNTLGA
ncbi:hypothetical protein A4R26_01750 [Niastella populi]|uniref:Uncharacterized protein n=1 Tax=Niastella populi TaxID=550983 RepID=A0A1V9GCZ7_9BACT|nr:hypothetical protein A4R26_01750 [Niastella populi]